MGKSSLRLLRVEELTSLDMAAQIPDDQSPSQLAAGMSRAALTVVAALGLLLTCVNILVMSLQVTERHHQQLAFTADAAAGEASTYLRAVKASARQIASRTQIRLALGEYVAGGRSLVSLRQFSSPRLQDGLNATPGMVALVRLARGGEPVSRILAQSDLPDALVSVLETLPPPDMSDGTHVSAPFTLHDRAYVIAQAAMHNEDDTLIGYDNILFDAHNLTAQLRGIVARFDDGVLLIDDPNVVSDHLRQVSSGTGSDIRGLAVHVGARLNNLRRGDLPAPEALTPALQRAGRLDVTSRTVGPDGIELVLAVDRGELRNPLALASATLGLILLAGIGLAMLLTQRLMKPYVKRITNVGQSMSQALRAKTQSLEIQLARSTDMQADLNEALVHKQQLVQELHHRVKNNLAVVIGMINLELDSEKDATDALYDLRTRIHAIASVHEQLYADDRVQEVSLRDYLRDLVMEVVTMMNRDEVDVEFDGEDSGIHIDRAVPLGLVVSELLTNSFKHKGDDSLTRIAVQLLREKQQTVLTYRDDGPPYPVDIDEEKSLGIRLIKGLTQQIEGTIDLPTPGTRDEDGMKTTVLRFRTRDAGQSSRT